MPLTACDCCKSQSAVPPQGPNINSITRLTDGSIVVMWKLLTLEEARGFITGYTVTAQQADFGINLRQSSMSVTVSPNTTSAVIDGLDPKLAYWVSVSAGTTAGGSVTNARMMTATTGMRDNYIRDDCAIMINHYCR